MNKIIPLQTEFIKPREFVRGGPEYDALVHDLDFIADSIRHSGIENVIMQYFVDRTSSNVCNKKLRNAKLVKIQKKSLFVLYAMVLRDYLGLKPGLFHANFSFQYEIKSRSFFVLLIVGFHHQFRLHNS